MDHVALHKQLRMKTTLEPIGLIPGTNIYRPADLLPVPYLNDVKDLGPRESRLIYWTAPQHQCKPSLLQLSSKKNQRKGCAQGRCVTQIL